MRGDFGDLIGRSARLHLIERRLWDAAIGRCARSRIGRLHQLLELDRPLAGAECIALLRFVGEPGLDPVKNLSLNLCWIDDDGNAPSLHWSRWDT